MARFPFVNGVLVARFPLLLESRTGAGCTHFLPLPDRLYWIGGVPPSDLPTYSRDSSFPPQYLCNGGASNPSYVSPVPEMRCSSFFPIKVIHFLWFLPLYVEVFFFSRRMVPCFFFFFFLFCFSYEFDRILLVFNGPVRTPLLPCL